MKERLELEERVRLVVRLLNQAVTSGKVLGKDSQEYNRAIEWLKYTHGKVDTSLRQELHSNMIAAFGLTEPELLAALDDEKPVPLDLLEAPNGQPNAEIELEALLPKGGWFEKYIEYTRYNEAPLSYHIGCSLAALGVALGRRCWMEEGHYKIYAPLNVLLIGPTGVVHKTSAIDIARKLIVEAAICPIMAEKITAEALGTSLKKNNRQFVYAPEFSVLFGKQQYNEGLSSLFLRLLDYPPELKLETQARGEEYISEPTISVLGGSTMSLMASSTPGVTLSGGFLNRFLIVVEHTTSRIFRRPRKGAGEESLVKMLKWLDGMTGEVKLIDHSPADQLHEEWYYRRKKSLAIDPQLAEVIQRGPTHVLRIAMLVHLIECNTLIICERCMRAAISILGFFERRAPDLIKAINTTTQNSSTDYVLEILIRLGGRADHSTLLRRCSSKLNSAQFRQVIQTLNESGRLKEGKSGLAKFYTIKEDPTSANS